MFPLLLPAAAAFVGRMMGKSEADEKLELAKKLANLTPDQAQAVDAIKKQSIGEMRTRIELGIGPFAPLPEQASARAQAIRQQRIDASQVTITQAEKAAIAAAPDKKLAMDLLVDQKVAEMTAGIQGRLP